MAAAPERDIDVQSLLVYLQGGEAVATTAISVIKDITVAADLPSLFHNICTNALVDKSWQVRMNSAVLLGELSRKFKLELLSLSTKEADGVENILAIKDIAVVSVLGGNTTLYSCELPKDAWDGGNRQQCIYTDKWLQRQKKELKRRLLVDTSMSRDIKRGLQYSSLDVDVDEEDFVIVSDNSKEGTEVNSSIISTVKGRMGDERKSTRNWFISIINYLSIGLLSPCWEFRHGCSVGLSKMMISFLKADDSNDTNNHMQGSQFSRHICEDLVCFGVYTLVLDRFIDCSEGGRSVSPVKEATAQMICLAARMLPNTQLLVGDIIDISYQMISFKTEWMVRHSGFLILKYFIPYHFSKGSAIFINTTSRYFDRIFDSVSCGLNEKLDELVSVCCDIIHAVGFTVHGLLLAAGHDDVISIRALFHVPLSDFMRALLDLAANSDEVYEKCKAISNASLWCLKALLKLSRDQIVVVPTVCVFFDTIKHLVAAGHSLSHSTHFDLYNCVRSSVVELASEVDMHPPLTWGCDEDHQNLIIKSGAGFALVSLMLSKSISDLCISTGKSTLLERPWMLGLDSEYKRLEILSSITNAVAIVIKSLTGVTCAIDYVVLVLHSLISSDDQFTAAQAPSMPVVNPTKANKRRKVDKFQYVDEELICDKFRVFVRDKLLFRDIVAPIEHRLGHVKSNEPCNGLCEGWLKLFPDADLMCFSSTLISAVRGLFRFILEEQAHVEDVKEYIQSLISTSTLQACNNLKNILTRLNDAQPVVVPDGRMPAGSSNRFALFIKIDGRVRNSSHGHATSKEKLQDEVAASVANVWFLYMCTMMVHATSGYYASTPLLDEILVFFTDMSGTSSKMHSALEPLRLVVLQESNQLEITDNILMLLIRVVRNAANATMLEQKSARTAETCISSCVVCCEVLNQHALNQQARLVALVDTLMATDSTLCLTGMHVLGTMYSTNTCSKDSISFILDHAWDIVVAFRSRDLYFNFLQLIRVTTSSSSTSRCDICDVDASGRLVLDHTFISTCIVLYGVCEDQSDKTDVYSHILKSLSQMHCTVSANGENSDAEVSCGIAKHCSDALHAFISVVTYFPKDICRSYLTGAISKILLSDSVDDFPHLGLFKASNNMLFRSVVCVIAAATVRYGNLDLSSDLDLWTKLALEGTNMSDELSRKSSMLSLGALVPLRRLGQATSRTSTVDDMPSTAFWPEIINALQRSSPLARQVNTNGDYKYISGVTPDKEHVLRSYQWEGVRWITQLWRQGFGGGILADEMGLGKTIQAVAAILVRRIERNFENKPALIVCPPSLTRHWLAEISRAVHDSEMLRGVLFDHMTERSTAELETLHGRDVVVASYNNVRQFISTLSSFEFEVVVVDEAHSMKNASSALALALFQLRSRRRLALTGTPVQNEVEDLWSLMNFLLPGFLGDYKTFRKSTVLPILKYFREVDKQKRKLLSKNKARIDKITGMEGSIAGLEALHTLHQRILLFILRRNKSLVVSDLPPKSIVDVFCPLSELQKEMYENFQDNANINDDGLVSLLSKDRCALEKPKLKYNGNALQALSYLKLLSVHPSLVINPDIHPEYYRKLVSSICCSGKIAVLIKVLVESGVIPHDEVVAFSGRDGLSALISPAIFVGADCLEDVKIGKTSRTNSAREVKISKNGKKLPVLKQKSPIVASPSTSSSDTSEEDEECKFSPVKTCKRVGPVKKCLIFAQHRSVLDLLESLVFKKNFPFIKYARLDGTIAPALRHDIIEQFRGDDDVDPIRVLLMTSRSCGLGVNLSVADTVIFVEMDWNPFVDLQAMDRAHRIGQTLPVTVFRLVADSTVEARIMELQSRKEAVSAEIINEDNANAFSNDTNLVALNDTAWKAVAAASKLSSSFIEGEEVGIDYECFNISQFMRDFDEAIG